MRNLVCVLVLIASGVPAQGQQVLSQPARGTPLIDPAIQSRGSEASNGLDIRRGTIADPVKDPGAIVMIRKVESYAGLTSLGGDPNNLSANAALQVEVEGLPGSRSQSTGIFARTAAAPIGTDVIAMSGWANVIGRSSAHAYGGYFEGRSDSPLGGAHGIEVRIKNVGGSKPVTQQASASRFVGLWATASDGPANVGVATGSGDTINGFDVGFQATSGGRYRTSAFAAEGLEYGTGSASAYLARGSHSIGLNFQDANFRNFAILLPDGTTPSGGIRFGASETVFQDASSVRGKASGLQIGTSGRVGFGKASVPRPTLPGAATDLASAITLLNAIRAMLIANGLAR
jgi:hypothetical protein